MKSSLLIQRLSVPTKEFSVEVSSLEVLPGQIACIMGKSGSGKSTLLNAVAGFVEVKSGQILLNGVNVISVPPEKRKIAFIFQKGALFPNLNVIQNVEFGVKIQGLDSEECTARSREWLKRLEILNLEKRRVSEISGGEAQRVQLARALITGFPVLLLDEPFSSLDVALRKQLREVLKSLIQEKQVIALLVTHDPEDAADMADKLYRMEQGKLCSSTSE